MELQVHNSLEIKEFISSLPLYFEDIALERFRPNGEKYSASKIIQPLIKIQLNNFTKIFEDKFHFKQNFKKKKVKISNIINNDKHIESPKSSSTNNILCNSSSSHQENVNTVSQGEEINKGLSSDSSSSLSNMFKANSIKYIRILLFCTIIETLLLISIEFIIIYCQINKITNKIHYLQNGYIILRDIVYTKFFITEGVITNHLNNISMIYVNVISFGGLSILLDDIRNELAFYRQEFTEIYDTFSLNDLSKEFKSYMEETKISIYTLTANTPEKLTLLFNNAMTRIPSSINNLVSDPYLMNMKNRDTYELMHNLLNEYYLNWEKANIILLNDSYKVTKLKIPLMIIVLCSILFSIIVLVIFLKLLSIFSLDREKPINLFLTMKKKVFEDLKNLAENFSNKLLNKFFWNTDGEDESQQEYQTNIHPNDINIVKFIAANDNHYSIKNAFTYMEIVIIIFLFLSLNLICFVIKYYKFRNKMENIYQFISLFEKINMNQIHFILSLDIIKSFQFNRSIPIINNEETREELFGAFMGLSSSFREMIYSFSKAQSFLKGEYIKKFEQYISGNITEILDQDYVKANKFDLSFSKGLKILEGRLFENIRIMTIQFCSSKEINLPKDDQSYNDISFKLKEWDFRIFETYIVIKHLLRNWFNGVIKLTNDYFYEYQSRNSMFYIIFFICLIAICIIFYAIIWRTYEEKLILLLKESVDLINLIPQEIKNIIIEKLNE